MSATRPWADGDELTPDNLNNLGLWTDGGSSATLASAVSDLESYVSSLSAQLSTVSSNASNPPPYDLGVAAEIIGELPWQRLPSSNSSWVSSSTVGIDAVLSVTSRLRVGSNVTENGQGNFGHRRMAVSIRRNVSGSTNFQSAAQVLLRSDTSVDQGLQAFDARGIITLPSSHSMHVLDGMKGTAEFDGSGHVNNLTGIYGWTSIEGSSGGTVVNARAFRAGFNAGSGTASVGSAFGLYIDTIPYGTNKWALWSDGDAPSRLGGGLAWGGGPIISSSSSCLATGSSSSAYLLARSVYFPASQVTTTIASSTTAAVDSTNLRVTFAAPSSGSVYVILKAGAYTPLSSDADLELNWGLLGDTASVLSSEILAMRLDVEDGGAGNTFETAGYVVAQTRDIAVSGTTTWVWAHRRRVGGTSPATIYGGRAGPAVMEVWAVV